jgi:hypothetical protein
MSSFAPHACPSPYPPGVENLTGAELARLAANEKCRQAVRTEVCRRLKDSPNKANYLTFRWFLPADDADKADAYHGLIGCCWNATKTRNRSGLFPRGYPETYCGARKRRVGSIAQPAGGTAEETREAIVDALVDCLCDLRTLPVPEVILTALNGGFHIDADVANALRRRVREESKYLFRYGDDVELQNEKGDPLTLFETLEDKPILRENFYNDVVEIIFQEKPQFVDELGEEGWEVLEQIVELVDNDLLPPTKRERERVLTEVFQKAYGVNERQARTHKSQFRRSFEAAVVAGKPVFERIAELLEWVGYGGGEKS